MNSRLILICVLTINSFEVVAQTSFPVLNINNQTLNSGFYPFYNPSDIVSTSDNSTMIITQDVQASYKAGNSIKLLPGFQAKAFTSNGYFRALIRKDIDVTIISPSTTPGTVGKLEKFELGIKLSDIVTQQINDYLNNNPGINPYDPDQISIEATFTSPSGSNSLVYGFYYRDYVQDLPNDTWIDQNTTYPWRIRFAPPQTGQWYCNIKVISPSFPTIQTDNFYFNCVPSGNKGYLREGAHGRILRFSETGESFYAIGQNICWPLGVANTSISPPSKYNEQRNNIEDLHTKGGNYYRLMMTPWTNIVEWEKLGDFDLRQPHLWEMDKIFEESHNLDMYIHLSLESAGTYLLEDPFGGPDWPGNPYNSANQSIIPGMNNPVDYFTNIDARNYTKKRFRYIISRWGYSTNIATYEIFNEIDKLDNYHPTLASPCLSWHTDMLNYIRYTLGDNKHLLTTSYSGAPDALFFLPTIDLTNSHNYNKSDPPDEPLVNYNSRWNSHNFLNVFGKPYILAEYGAEAASTAIDDCTDWEMHNALWSSAFMGGYGAGLYWWRWNDDIQRSNYTALRSFMNTLDLDDDFYFPQKGLGAMQSIESYTLVKQGGKFAAGWMHNESYYWANISPCGPGMPVSVPSAEKLKIENLRLYKKYDLNWYYVPHSGPISFFIYTEDRSSIFGTLKTPVVGHFSFAGEFAYRFSEQINRNDEISFIDTLECPNDTIHVNGIYEDDINGTLYSYNWNFGNGQSSNLAHPKVYYDQSGIYTVTLSVSDSTGYYTDTLSQQVVVLDCDSSNHDMIPILANDNIVSGSIKLYPNPNKGNFYIHSTGVEMVQYSIYDAIGTLILERDLSIGDEKIVQIDLNQQSKGIYLMKIMERNGNLHVKRIIVN